MQKNTVKTINNIKKRDPIASITSSLTGYSYEQCRCVRVGKRENEQIENVLLEVAERYNVLQEEVKRVVPFDLPLRHPKTK